MPLFRLEGDIIFEATNELVAKQTLAKFFHEMTLGIENEDFILTGKLTLYEGEMPGNPN